MGDLTPFDNGEFRLDITPHEADGFHVVASGLARALGFRQALDLTRNLPESEKGYELVRTPGGEQHVGYLTEAGFYRALGMRQAARIQDAAIRDQVERFQGWVYGVVLPGIRSGSIAAPPLTGKDLLAAAVLEAQATIAAKDERIAELEPKASYVDIFVAGSDLLTFRTVASTLDVGEQWLRQTLIERGWIYAERSSRWSDRKGKVPQTRYSEYSNKKPYFRRVENHDAPRFGGEVMHTLKITAAGANAIAKAVARWQAGDAA